MNLGRNVLQWNELIWKNATDGKKSIRVGTKLTHSLKAFLSNPSYYENLGHLRHFAHYEVAWQIIKDYPIFGVGNLKFRYICHNNNYLNTKISYTYERCSNHPHQVHFEILSEQGVVGYLIIIFAIFIVLLNSLKSYRKTGDLTNLSSILFVAVFFIPFLPTGSFFSTFNGTIFWINFSILYAFSQKSN